MFKNQPKGLIPAALSNMGERFGYYIMNAVLVLFLCSKFGLSEETSALIYSFFYAGIYVLSLVGGLIADKTQNYKGTIIWGLIIMTIGYVVLAIPVGLYKLTHMWGGLTPEQLVGSIQENGDSIYTYSAGYICRNLPNTAKLLLRSFSAQGAQWVQGVLGTALGEPIVYTVDASWVLGVGFILALLAAALPQAGETVPLGRRTKAGVWGIVLCVIALSFVTALNWTPINYTTIFGLQGRYWLPVLPLVLALVHHNRTFAVQKPAERKAVFAMLCLTSFVILQGAGLYATFQMPS